MKFKLNDDISLRNVLFVGIPLLILAYFDMPRNFYILLRFFTSAIFCILSWKHYKQKLILSFSVIYLFLGAVLYNPFLPFSFHSEVWGVLNLVTLFIFVHNLINIKFKSNTGNYSDSTLLNEETSKKEILTNREQKVHENEKYDSNKQNILLNIKKLKKYHGIIEFIPKELISLGDLLEDYGMCYGDYKMPPLKKTTKKIRETVCYHIFSKPVIKETSWGHIDCSEDYIEKVNLKYIFDVCDDAHSIVNFLVSDRTVKLNMSCLNNTLLPILKSYIIKHTKNAQLNKKAKEEHNRIWDRRLEVKD